MNDRVNQPLTTMNNPTAQLLKELATFLKGPALCDFHDYATAHTARTLASRARAEAERINKMLSSQPHGCHVDLEPGTEPDGCVLDEGRPQDCIYAKGLASKEACRYWQPIVKEKELLAQGEGVED